MVTRPTFLALVLLATGCATAPAPARPDGLVCTVRETGDPVARYRLDLRLTAGRRTQTAPWLVTRAEEWCTLQVVSQGSRAAAPVIGPDGEPALGEVTVIDSGVVLIARCSPEDDGKILVDLRVYCIRDARVESKVEDGLLVGPGEERTITIE